MSTTIAIRAINVDEPLLEPRGIRYAPTIHYGRVHHVGADVVRVLVVDAGWAKDHIGEALPFDRRTGLPTAERDHGWRIEPEELRLAVQAHLVGLGMPASAFASDLPRAVTKRPNLDGCAARQSEPKGSGSLGATFET